MEKREQVLNGIHRWIDAKITELANNNVWMALASNTLKRVAKDWIETVIPVDMLLLLLSNRGVVDADVLANELIMALNNAPDIQKDFSGIMLKLSRGVISIELPSNSVVKGLLNGNNVLNFREGDIKELAQFINNKEDNYV